MRTGRPPHPNPSLSQQPQRPPAQFQVSTDDQGRTSVVHVGPNRRQRQQAQGEQKKLFKKAIKRIHRLTAKAQKAQKAAPPGEPAMDPDLEPEIVEVLEEG